MDIESEQVAKEIQKTLDVLSEDDRTDVLVTLIFNNREEVESILLNEIDEIHDYGMDGLIERAKDCYEAVDNFCKWIGRTKEIVR